ncbi:MAG: 2-amino-4-hydroxy-6-hydroxymethyldihydropteridine diphosphokinase, partial [Steroidobacteraceae bacterium]
MARVYVAIGGNVEPERWFPVAARELRRRFPGARFSSCYRNPAYGFVGADFYNAAAGFDTDASVEEVLAQCHAIEEFCGRRRDDPKWAPRVMDIDLLLYG